MLEHYTQEDFDKFFNLKTAINDEKKEEDDDISDHEQLEMALDANEDKWFKPKEIPIKKILKGMSSFNTMSDILTSFKDFREFDQFCIF